MKYVVYDGTKVYPSKIVCIGRNYVAHIEELNNEIPSEPVIFIKPNSSISDEIYSLKDEQIHYEAELSFIVKSNELKGVGFGLDLTKREVQDRLKSKGLPWERAKAFDNAAVFSEFYSIDSGIQNLKMELYINDKLVQKALFELMLYKPIEILNEVTKFLTLEDGDILMTGTPKGVGKIHTGDVFIGKIYDKNSLLIEKQWNVK